MVKRSYSSSFSVHPFHLVPEQRDKLPSDKCTSFGELSSPGGIVVDKDGFVYVSNFAGVGILCIVCLLFTIITIECL